jgi:hypothetical protein
MATLYTRYTKKSSASWAAGLEASPIAEAAYRVEDLSFNSEASDTVQTNTYVGEYQGAPPRASGRYGIVALGTELRGAPTNAPFEGALLRACGFGESGITFPVGETHVPCYMYQLGDLHLNTMTPPGIVDPIDLKVNYDREVSSVLSSVGSLSIRLEANQIPKLQFNFRGILDDTIGDETHSSHDEVDVPTITVGPIPVAVQDSDFFLREQDSSIVSYTLTDAESSPGDYLVIAGDHTAELTPWSKFKVDAGANVGIWTVVSSTYDAGTGTTINVLEELAGPLYSPGKIVEIWHAYSNLVVLRYNIDVGNVIDERSDINGSFGFSQPLLTSRNPVADCQIETTALSEFQPYNLFIQNKALDVYCHINNGGGDLDEITIYQTVRLSDFPTKTDVNGKFVYDLKFMQDIGADALPLTLAWAHVVTGVIV